MGPTIPLGGIGDIPMDYDKLKQKKEKLEQAKPSIPLEKILQKQREFEIEYAHNSTALAGNSLTLEQTRAILDAVNPPEHFPRMGRIIPPARMKHPTRPCENGKPLLTLTARAFLFLERSPP